MALDILVVDDEPDIRELMAGVLGDEGYSVRTADTAERALEEVRSRTPRLVILDVWLQGSGMDGLSLLKAKAQGGDIRPLDGRQPEIPLMLIEQGEQQGRSINRKTGT